MHLEQNVGGNLSIDIDFIQSYGYYMLCALYLHKMQFPILYPARWCIRVFFLSHRRRPSFISRLCAKIMKFASVLCNIPRA